MTNVQKNRIAVVSADVSFADFFAWEARACGCPVEIFSEPPQSFAGFDLAVLDLRVGVCLSEDSRCRLAVVVPDGVERSYATADFLWEFPIDIEVVRAAYEQAETRQEAKAPPEVEQQRFSIYVVSEERRTVLYRNRAIALTESEWRILMLLGEREGAVVPKECLAEALSGAAGNAVNVHVCHLRQKLEAPFGVRVLETVRGGGYRLKVALKRWGE